MPLVRVSEKDDDGFDVADMSCSSMGQGGGWNRVSAASAAGMPRGKTQLSSYSDVDDLVSIDSPSNHRDEADNSSSYSRMSRSNKRGSAHDGGSSNEREIKPCAYSQPPLCETSDGLDLMMQHDPRNPFYSGKHATSSSNPNNCDDGDEDETESLSGSFSTMDSSSYGHHNRRLTSQSQAYHRPYSITEGDDSSICSSSRLPGRDETSSSAYAGIISQLESQVASLNFDLATTKSSLDELKLENRKLVGDRSKLSNNVKLLQEENEQLVKKIEQLEREKIIRNMQGTQGRGRANVPTNLYSSDDPNLVCAGIQEGGGLEVPFRSSFPRSGLRSSENNRSSLLSVDFAQDHLSTSNVSRESIALGDADDIDGGTAGQQDETEEVEQQFGIVPKEDDIFVPLKFNRREENDDDDDDDDCHDDPSPLDDDDPFATWSAPGDPIRETEPSRKWLGLGGGNRNRRPAEPQREEEQPPDDPFDTMSKADDGGGMYESFATRNDCDDAENSTVRSGSTAPQDRGRRFGLFGFGQRRANRETG
mmetsp:Transcript_23404/g.52182  ORF Transcript_23404/g.52182 Transcript_23404/m.52182 type:complete len:535 (+) Transcript_23404:110-1714(+)